MADVIPVREGERGKERERAREGEGWRKIVLRTILLAVQHTVYTSCVPISRCNVQINT
jgi:hypothetical protein